MYGDPPFYSHLKWPETHRAFEMQAGSVPGSHWTLIGFMECSKVPVICHVNHLIQLKVLNKTNLEVAYELCEMGFDN